MAVANVGVINDNQRSLVAELADELLSFEEIDTTVINAILDEGLGAPKWLIASVRNRNLAINIVDFVQAVYGRSHSGGRRGAAAAKVPLDAQIQLTMDYLAQDASGKGMESFVATFVDAYTEKSKAEFLRQS